MPLPHSTKQDLEGYINGILPVEASDLVRSHLEVCEECQLRLAEVAMDGSWDGPERRSEPRVRVNFPGHLKILDPMTSVGPPHDVQVIEISRKGLKIQTPRFVIPKTLVQIRFNNQVLLGEVRYCVKADSGYYAGLRQIQDFPAR